ncbi:hypothetical protein QTA58_06020 [Neorhizobium sp. CSC1952]|uniref:Yip1 domain-containing protein n=1 Tax=Xaviernesmea oryzae TaxID=464029 RepID=A0A1X7EVI8_9HYPH|nr:MULTISPECIES: hypothetical protein [Rhizobium/Agrobacterium group]WJR68307.1 hypothetical protein QTA58_06020 [Rhizobium sp. CSC1952]SMF41060.1 hypothetical protein SAMN02982989_1888 [Xaviernesmea oryzae]
MPSYHEVRLYLSGLWLLIRGEAQGFRLLDISDRGMMRSFWAFVWCLPAAVLSWLWWRAYLLESMPPGARIGGVFYIRMAMLEVFNWMMPLILAGLLCGLIGIGRKFPAVVVTVNWLSVPFAYLYGLLSLRFLLPSGLDALLAFIHFILLIVMVISLSRVMRMICGPQPLMVTGLVLVLIVPGMLLTEALQRFLGIYPL